MPVIVEDANGLRSALPTQTDVSKSRLGVVRLVLLNGGYCSDPRPRGSARWAHARRDRSVTAARAQRKCRRRAQSSSVATQQRPHHRPDARVCWMNGPPAVAVCSPKGGRESATDSAICGGIGNATARNNGSRHVSANRDHPARVPTHPDLPLARSRIAPRAELRAVSTESRSSDPRHRDGRREGSARVYPPNATASSHPRRAPYRSSRPSATCICRTGILYRHASARDRRFPRERRSDSVCFAWSAGEM